MIIFILLVICAIAGQILYRERPANGACPKCGELAAGKNHFMKHLVEVKVDVQTEGD